MQAVTDPRVRHGLSRFARWASLRRIPPAAVDDAVIERFIAELEAASLIRNLGARHRSVALTWNILCALQPGSSLSAVAVPTNKLGADSRALGAASSLLPRGCRSASRLVCHARPARRAGAGKSAGTADAAIAATTTSIRP